MCLKEALSVLCTAEYVSVFLLGHFLSPNQYDAFNILTKFAPFLHAAFSNFSCPQMVWWETCVPLVRTAHLGPPYLSLVLQEPTATGVGWETSVSAWTARPGECDVCWTRLSSAPLQRDYLTLQFPSTAACPYLQPFCRGVPSGPRAPVQMFLHSPLLYACISRSETGNLNCVSCISAFTVP